MKALARRLWPDSFGGRLRLTMLLSIVLLFVANIYAACFIQYKFLGMMEKERSDTITAFFVLLSDLEWDQQDSALARLTDLHHATQSSLSFALLPTAPEGWAMRPEAEHAVAMLRKNLTKNSITPLPDIRARIFSQGAADDGDPWNAVAVDRISRYPLLQMAVASTDGVNWLSITQPLYNDEPRHIWIQRLIFLAEFVLFALLVLLLLRPLLRPFQQLAQAAERVGKHPEIASPLPETGCREIREAAQSFNRMQARIRENLAERDRMLAAMAHDLRTPLTRAQLRIEAVDQEDLREKLLHNIREVRHIAEQSLELARSLTISEKTVPLDLVTFVQSCVDDFMETGGQVTLAGPLAPAEAVPVQAKPLCLKRCLENLLRNAVTYGKRAEVRIGMEADTAYIDVCDEGPGIPDACLERIFEPYFRLDASRNRESGGTGLGLSIARNMIFLCNGSLILENRPEGGLRARIALPRLKRD